MPLNDTPNFSCCGRAGCGVPFLGTAAGPPQSRTLCFSERAVRTATLSEGLFESVCRERGIVPRRIPEGSEETADYEIVLGTIKVVAEVKQLDRTPPDAETAGVIAPSGWVRKQIGDSYAQLENCSGGASPTMLVLYNNAGFLSRIDSFTVSTAMFGDFGIQLELKAYAEPEVVVVRKGFLGGRKVTRDTCRSLSVVAVMESSDQQTATLEAYHNPFATIPLAPEALAGLARAQFVHRQPHMGKVVSWSPVRIEA
jgi:hypothetical protein